MMALYSSMRRLISLWNEFADAGSSPIGGNEQSATVADVSASRRCSIASRLSRNHSGDGSLGRCFEIRKKCLTFPETNARTSFPPTQTTTLCGRQAMMPGSRSSALYARSPQYVLQYLGRYTHRVAISNHRLVAFAEDKVTFRWRDSAHQNEQKLLTLSLDEFLRRFLLHLLPEGFMRIRNFGFLANRRRATTLPLCFQLLGSAPQTEQEASSAKDVTPLWLCPKCGGPMRVNERLTAAEIYASMEARLR
jgi:Putative transposase